MGVPSRRTERKGRRMVSASFTEPGSQSGQGKGRRSSCVIGDCHGAHDGVREGTGKAPAAEGAVAGVSRGQPASVYLCVCVHRHLCEAVSESGACAQRGVDSPAP